MIKRTLCTLAIALPMAGMAQNLRAFGDWIIAHEHVAYQKKICNNPEEGKTTYKYTLCLNTSEESLGPASWAIDPSATQFKPMSVEVSKLITCKLKEALEEAEQGWTSTRKMADSLVVHQYSAANGIDDDLRFNISQPNGDRTYSTPSRPYYEYLEASQWKNGGQAGVLNIYINGHCPMASSQTGSFPMNDINAYIRSYAQKRRSVNFAKSSNESALLSGDAKTSATIYSYDSAQQLEDTLKSLFEDFVAKGYPCTLVDTEGYYFIADSLRCVLIYPHRQLILIAETSTPGGLYVPHTWWK